VPKGGINASCVPRGGRSGFGVNSVLRTGRIFDTPPLGRALQSAFSALGLLVEFKPLPKPRALCGALGLPELEMPC